MAPTDSTPSTSLQVPLHNKNSGRDSHAASDKPSVAIPKAFEAQPPKASMAAPASHARSHLTAAHPENQSSMKTLSQLVDKVSISEASHDQENLSPIKVLLRQLSEQTAGGGDKAKSQATGTSFSELQAARNKSAQPGTHASDVTALQKKLAEAEQKIAQMDQQLAQQHQAHQSLEQALTGPVGARLSPSGLPDQMVLGQGALMGQSHWNSSQSHLESLSASSMPDSINSFNGSAMLDGSGGWTTHGSQLSGRAPYAPQPQRTMNGRIDNLVTVPPHITGNQRSTRSSFGGPWGSNTGSVSGLSPPITPIPFGGSASGIGAQYQPRPIGTNFAVSNTETGSQSAASNPWNSSLNPAAQHYVPPIEPINYRRLLDRNTSCNWSYIVDKIVCNNDQQASIFLQQKLKVSSQEQKFELVEAIIAQAYPLMVNRFGNFLIQRCFEHGTPEQVIAIANAIRGKTLDLSMDAFGCHVVQKAFDVVPEEYKALMVHELLRRIPETVVHRYACHVWQKLFELRWSESPPQIMKYVNEALRGMWHEVALGETGSLVVQNIFENCLEEDKRPCIEEVLSSIDIVAHGQFGNWCIQHICEHGAPSDKRRAIEQVLCFATEYSTDQFASKVVEKCLKVGGGDFLDHYLDKVCEGRPDRPRMPLIDIAGDQYGNYLIQYILINAESQHRELVAQHVRKHMVSLRGSKFGSRVAMLCTNPAIQTRPGPPSTMPLGNTAYYTNTTQVQPGFTSRGGFGGGRPDFR